MQKKKSNRKLPLRVYLMYLIVVSFVISGVSFSKYMVSQEKSVNARTAKIGDIDLYETKKVDNRTVPTTSGQFMLIPGVDIVKDPKVYYLAGEIACSVDVILTLPEYWVQDDEDNSKFGFFNEDSELLGFQVNTSEFAFKGKIGDEYTFSKELQPGEAIGSVLSPVSVIVDDKIFVSANTKEDLAYIESVLSGMNESCIRLDIQAIVTQID